MADLEAKNTSLSLDEEASVSQESDRVPLPAYSDDDSRTDIHLDGGFKAKLTTFGAFTALFFAFGQMNAFGTFHAWYSTHQLARMPASTISWIGSLQLWIFFLSVSKSTVLPISNL
jgi:hypothetical protein